MQTPTDSASEPKPIRFISKRSVAESIGYHPHHVDRLVKAGKFPKPVRMGSNRVVFVADEVEAWKRARIQERDEGRAPKPRNLRTAAQAEA